MTDHSPHIGPPPSQPPNHRQPGKPVPPYPLPAPPVGGIQTLDDLKNHLKSAVALELSTIPLYLYGEWSIKAGGPSDYLKTVVVQEMLHLALAGNVWKAVGGEPQVYNSDMIPKYPSYMAGRVPPLLFNLRAATRDNVETFIQVELPEEANAPAQADKYHTIGQFYKAIEEGLKTLNEKLPNLFDPSLKPFQFPQSGYRHTPGLIDVVDLNSALAALELIVLQGEGKPRTSALSATTLPEDHYDIFVQMKSSATPDWKTYDVIENPLTKVYISEPGLYQTSLTFDAAYSYLLLSIQKCWATKDETIRDGLVNNIFLLMKRVLLPISTLMLNQTFQGKAAAPCFECYYFTSSPVNELHGLVNQLRAAIKAWPSGSDQQKALQGILDAVEGKGGLISLPA